MSSTLKAISHRPSVRGGNGRPMPAVQAMAMKALGAEWVAEHVVKTLRKPKDGYPHHYKIDVAHPGKMIALELDGGSHGTLERKAQDAKKDNLLRSFGWKVLRLSNAEAESMFSTFGSEVTLRISQAAS